MARRSVWNRLFLVASFSLVGMLFFSVAQELLPEWRSRQAQYYRRLADVTGDPSKAGTPIKIRQIHLPDMNRVDRCITCHTGIDNPKMAGQPQPFAAHPNLGVPNFLSKHPFDEMGCTVCHQGQGMATTVKHAHGPVPHWEQPLLAKGLTEGTCTSCHGDVNHLGGAERLRQAKVLFVEKGCIGCHNLHGKGMLVGPELDETFGKSPAQFDFRYVKGMEGRHEEGTVMEWVIDHFRDPQRVVPGYPALGIPESAMPKYELTEDEIRMLTALMMSFSSEAGDENFPIPARLKVPAPQPAPEPMYASAVERGAAVFKKYGCVGCHGPQGRGGVRNANMDLGEEVPSLTYAAEGYSKEELKSIIRDGRYPARADRAHLSPPLWMPSWKEKLSEEELDAVVEYIFSLSPEKRGPAPAAAAAPASAQTQ